MVEFAKLGQKLIHAASAFLLFNKTRKTRNLSKDCLHYVVSTIDNFTKQLWLRPKQKIAKELSFVTGELDRLFDQLGTALKVGATVERVLYRDLPMLCQDQQLLETIQKEINKKEG